MNGYHTDKSSGLVVSDIGNELILGVTGVVIVHKHIANLLGIIRG